MHMCTHVCTHAYVHTCVQTCVCADMCADMRMSRCREMPCLRCRSRYGLSHICRHAATCDALHAHVAMPYMHMSRCLTCTCRDALHAHVAMPHPRGAWCIMCGCKTQESHTCVDVRHKKAISGGRLRHSVTLALIRIVQMARRCSLVGLVSELSQT